MIVFGDARVPAKRWKKIVLKPGSDCWHWTGAKRGKGYGYVNVRGTHHSIHVVIYELLVGPIPNDRELDHRCRNKACCNPMHMRIATRAQNVQHQQRPRNNTSGYKGVCFDKSKRRWLAQIRSNGTLKNLGRFKSPEEAAVAYDRAALRWHGEFAVLNFAKEN